MSKIRDGLHIRQEQRLQQRLNPRLMALGRVLEMPAQELEDEVRRELDENPALEASDPLQGSVEGESTDTGYKYRTYSGSTTDGIDPALMAVDEGETMTEVLMRRLAADMELTEADAAIARNIIGNLDSNGYLTRALEDIPSDVAQSDGIAVTDADVERIFVAIRRLDPAGICAEDLRDCLLLQLERKTPTQPVRDAITILDDHFRLFSLKHYDKLISAAGLTRDRLTAALDEIQTLNPRPAASLEPPRPSDRSAHIVPDVVFHYDEESDSFYLTPPDSLPELAVSDSFVEIPDEPKDDETDAADTDAAERGRAMAREHRRKALEFARRRRDDAVAFIDLLKMRQETLMAVAQAIVLRQRHFFVTGDRADIEPMVLREIAGDTGLDISVVSRAVAGKYISTPHGIYPLKMFFNEAPTGDVSAHRVMELISKLISSEDKSRPKSDREICAELESQGIDISRRTVAKYRERLGFPVARLRRELSTPPLG